jgi:phage gpG-like protein
MLKIVLKDRATLKLRGLPEELRKGLRVVIVRGTQELASLVRANLSGKVLNVRSGRLIGSIKSELHETESAILGTVYTDGVPYAAIHEYGGKTAAHDIYPRNARALHFWVGGKEVFASHVHHPGSVIPERSYMRSALAELRSRLIGEMVAESKKLWN